MSHYILHKRTKKNKQKNKHHEYLSGGKNNIAGRSESNTSYSRAHSSRRNVSFVEWQGPGYRGAQAFRHPAVWHANDPQYTASHYLLLNPLPITDTDEPNR